MTESEARKQVVAAGRRLLEAGLIVRTWGNVSARAGNDRFAITPSGKAYEHLEPADIAFVNVADGKSSISPRPGTGGSAGPKPRRMPSGAAAKMKPPKPSSEKNPHAAVYRLRPDVRFVIHTHQVWASAVSTLRRDIDVPPDLVPMLGAKVRCAAFALPTTKKLADNVAAVLQQAGADERAVLLAGHGTVCFGADAEEAFAVAEALEKACQRFLRGDGDPGAGEPGVRGAIEGQGGHEPAGEDPVGGIRPVGGVRPARRFYNSRRFDDHFKLYLDATADEPFPDGEGKYICIPLGRDPGRLVDSVAPRSEAGSPPGSDQPGLPPEAVIHRRIYERWSHMRAVVHCIDEDVVEASRSGKPVRPYLDDFAQLVGPVAKVATGGLPDVHTEPGGQAKERGEPDGYDWERVGADAARKLRGRFAVIVQGHGALCCAPNETDALAVAYVMAKNCKALVEGRPFGGARPIAPWEAWLMRLVYTVSYSKRAGEDGGTGAAAGGRLST